MSDQRKRAIAPSIIGSWLPDPFFDSYEEETLTCYDILNLMGLSNGSSITLTFDKLFLKELVKSHLLHIKTLEESE